MTITQQHTACSISDDFQDPIDWGLIPGHFGKIRNVKPLLPKCNLLEVMPHEDVEGRREPWEAVEQRYRNYAAQEFEYGSATPYRSISFEVRLILGVLGLPRQLVWGTCKRLLGEVPDMPSTWELFAVGFALFNPPRSFWGRDSWIDVCRRAELMQAHRDAITAQVQELLELGR